MKKIIIVAVAAAIAGSVWYFGFRKKSTVPSVGTGGSPLPGDTNGTGGLVVGNIGGSVSAAAIVPDFSFVPTYLSVAFTNLSAPSVAKYYWQFGDGTTSTESNPTHIYSADGSYNVSLTVTVGVLTKTISKSVTVAHQPTVADKYEGQAIKITGTDPIFLVKKGKRYHIVSPAQFQQLFGELPMPGLYINITPAEMAAIPSGGELTDTVINSFDGYNVKIRHEIPTPSRSDLSWDRYDFDGVFANINNDRTRFTGN